MKKVFMTLAFVLAFVLSLTMITACADHSEKPAPAESTPAPALTESTPVPAAVEQAVPAAAESTLAPEPVPAAEEKELDAIVGSWKYPANPYGGDFDKYIVLNEDGSWLYATNLYTSGSSGSYTQTIQTNEDFYWLKTGSNSYELHENYHDVNGEFITPLTYDAEADALYMYGELYANRDSSFVLSK
ncbi:MAG: hypothetical protein IKS55_05740 [Oscillospiraceae bacterium]|nr:hypothetical protein [Oscillospiraceae bacterium]